MDNFLIKDEPNQMPQNISIRIMFTLKEYIEKMTDFNREVYGKTNGDALTGIISRILSTKTNEYIKEYKDDNTKTEKEKINEYGNKLKETTKNYLVELLKNNDEKLTNFGNRNIKNYFDSFNDLERKIWILGLIYGMSGYEKLDNSIKSQSQRTKEMCDILEISKLKFIITAISMSFYSAKLMYKAQKNDGELPVVLKRK